MPHVPMTPGAVAPTHNVPDVADRAFRFTLERLAGSFLDSIAKWNDPKIVTEHPALWSVDQAVTVVQRSNGSSTTYC